MRERKINKNWVRDAAFRDEPAMMRHHTIPKHHGGHNSPIVTVDAWEHAQLHKDIFLNGYNDGITYIPSGCKECWKAYKVCMGIHETWKIERDNYHDYEFDIIGYYENDVNSEDILRNIDEDVIIHDFNNVKDTDFNIDRELDVESLRLELNDLFKRLKDRERNVLTEHFGLDGKKPRQLWEIGENYGITIPAVRQIKERAIRRLRNMCIPQKTYRKGVPFAVLHNHRKLSKLLEIFSK